MRSTKEWMSRTYVKFTGTADGMVAGVGDYAKFTYVAFFIIGLAASLASHIFLTVLFGIPGYTLFFIAIIWGLFFGVTFLYLMPAKWIAAIAGGLFGAGGSDWIAAAGAITASNVIIKRVYTDYAGSADGFSEFAVWLFAIIVLILCIPAFFEQVSAEQPSSS